MVLGVRSASRASLLMSELGNGNVVGTAFICLASMRSRTRVALVVGRTSLSTATKSTSVFARQQDGVISYIIRFHMFHVSLEFRSVFKSVQGVTDNHNLQQMYGHTVGPRTRHCLPELVILWSPWFSSSKPNQLQ